MQPIKRLHDFLEQTVDREHYLFALDDLSGVLPDHGRPAFKALIKRAVTNGLLVRVCRGIYICPKADYPAGFVLYHTAARLRACEFNYISLESALSDAGLISQIPISWLTLMSSGRSYIVDCGNFGHIEFVHTKKRAENLVSQLTYDSRCRLWRASVSLALKDMVATGRSMDNVDMEAISESF